LGIILGESGLAIQETAVGEDSAGIIGLALETAGVDQ
jgi:hypothetical protein